LKKILSIIKDMDYAIKRGDVTAENSLYYLVFSIFEI